MNGRESELANLVRNGSIVIPSLADGPAYVSWLEKFQEVKRTEIKTALGLMQNLRTAESLSEEQKDTIRNLIRIALTNTQAARSAIAFVAILSSIGIAYILWALQ